MSCDASTECGDGLECLCGRCTQACSAGVQCGAALVGASCELTSMDALASSCDAQADAPAAICALQCERDGDCAAAADGVVCREALCVATSGQGQPGTSGTGTGGTAGASGAGGQGSPAGTGSPGDAGVGTDAGDPCPDGTIVDSAQQCLLDTAFCRQLPDGRYCTGTQAASCPLPTVPIRAGEPCPEGATCAQHEEGVLCQQLPVVTFSECQERGGRVLGDRGDGSLYRSGCPLDRAEIGRTEGGEGGLCCALEITDCAPQAPHYIGTCEPANRYYWNGYGCFGMTGCECVGADCDAGFPDEASCLFVYQGCGEITQPCGGLARSNCADTEFCAYTPGLHCGDLDGSAICTPRPISCPLDEDDPVCGCDGTTHASRCEANAAGTGIRAFGACE